MPIALHQLPDDVDALKSLLAEQATKLDQFVVRNEQLTTENQRYKFQVLTLTEQLNLALARRYAASSEKLSPDQICLFDEAELDSEMEPDSSSDDEEITVAAHQRKKRGRKPLPDHLPRIDVTHELAEDERRCEQQSWINLLFATSNSPPRTSVTSSRFSPSLNN